MTQNRKIGSILVTGALVTALFAGCASGASSGSTASEVSASVVESSASSAAPESSASASESPASSSASESSVSTPESSASEAASLYTAGTYTATADGRNGPITVSVTFDADKIVSVTIDDHAETPDRAGPAIDSFPAAIVENQSLNIDAVSGATITGDAILAAVEDCVEQAGGDAAALK